MHDPHGHPRGLYVLFFSEMWERFSYYGMRALLIFYMTQTFRFGDELSYTVYGAYTALVYLTPVFGGLIADRVLGYRRAVIVGSLLMAAGQFCLAIESVPVFYFALSLLIVGNGFFKANISTIVGKLYAAGDARRDAGFTIFYMGINVGAGLAPVVCGWVGETYGWRWGFVLAGVGMVAGLVNFLWGQARFRERADAGGPLDPANLAAPARSREVAVYAGVVVAVGAACALMNFPEFVGYLFLFSAIPILAYLVGYSFTKCEPVARHRLWVALTLTAVSVVFWAFFEQAGSSLNLFTDRNVDREVLGLVVPAAVFQAVNPLFILIFGPLFAALWVALGARNPTIPLKFGLGILQLGLGYVALFYGAWISRDHGSVALVWLVLGYLFHTTGELCLSPVGLSMITKLSPPRMTGMMMGVWFLSISFAQYVAGLLARLTSVAEEGGAAGAIDPVATVMVYGGLFGQLALIALAVGAITMLLAPLVNRGTHGIR